MAAGEQQGREYLRRHRIPELLQRLGALLLYHRPERPREFLIQALERVKAAERAEGEYPYLMDEANLAAMFSLLDVVGQGCIRPAQYREALKTLGLSTDGLQFGDDVTITLDVFKEEVKKKMRESWTVY
ncbi:EF-hand calcium-binding domain-containing protein 10 [Falco biarmicus]|uniref:EF-hand calcium-binding domain-containing protein 10 n=1 Tax=Falco rusticolus TaxID=120794 RepID=UPI0018868CE5|nr:EF-hand calcium-binding domain-containing protein 10 [Falco rusticolus]XP_055567081.1 EF-hand calcium-binding domain-containing protein 10 [Falco cherrug]XP_055663534.1 EF-hand calcium-binding domain-containing protein 10 [Falco peregrinus]XP_056195813.1 EF-hand calcium-binding domain-containing protein 10 [Falco biarmicus]